MMKRLKVWGFLVLLLSISLLMTGCKEKASETYEAKASDFDNNIFTNNQNQSIGLFGTDLTITGIHDKEAKVKTSLQPIIASIYDGTGDQVEKTYANAKIETKDDQYIITADEGINLVFTKVGERIIKDEENVEYSSPASNK